MCNVFHLDFCRSNGILFTCLRPASLSKEKILLISHKENRKEPAFICLRRNSAYFLSPGRTGRICTVLRYRGGGKLGLFCCGGAGTGSTLDFGCFNATYSNAM